MADIINPQDATVFEMACHLRCAVLSDHTPVFGIDQKGPALNVRQKYVDVFCGEVFKTFANRRFVAGGHPFRTQSELFRGPIAQVGRSTVRRLTARGSIDAVQPLLDRPANGGAPRP